MIQHLLRLYLRMLRYRVAAMIWMFMLLASAYHGGLQSFRWAYLWATIALASSYVAATTVNDVADREIDTVNHPLDRGRPLVSGEATERDLYLVHVLAAGAALGSATTIGPAGLALVALSLAIGLGYSLGPVRLSHRTYLAPLMLAVAYVVIPYSLGIVAAGASPSGKDALFGGALFALFLARINLKDFRDREGDARYGRPTLLLRFGKSIACFVSLAALAAGDALLLAALNPPTALVVLIEVFVAGIGWMLYVLWRSDEARGEQVAIGIGAKMGNGLLITVLAWLILAGLGATLRDRLVLAVTLTALFAFASWALVTRPDDVVVGYKG
ncbi:MAG: UbiA family prenyltransferase [Actinomycetota bacterium]